MRIIETGTLTNQGLQGQGIVTTIVLENDLYILKIFNNTGGDKKLTVKVGDKFYNNEDMQVDGGFTQHEISANNLDVLTLNGNGQTYELYR